jgi:hypothetical protein
MRKHFPEGTFVATPLRVLAIIQLCVVFTFLAWVGGYPFLGKTYENLVMKNKYEVVLKSPYFETLSETKQANLFKGYDHLNRQMASSFPDKLLNSFQILFIDLSLASKVWILLSIILPIFVLLRVEGAIQCTWLLPIVISLGFISSLTQKKELTFEEKLFPTEDILVTQYMETPLEGTIFEQSMKLQEALDLYIVKCWLNEAPSNTPETLLNQKAKGHFLFNIARLEAHAKDRLIHKKQCGTGQWVLFLIWNFGIATGLNYSNRKIVIHHNPINLN